MKKSTATIFLFAASVIWGISFMVMKSLLDYLPANHLLAYRFTVGAVGLSFVLFTYKKEFTPKAWLRGLAVGACMYVAFILQTYGLLFIGSGKNALITAVYVVLVPFIMWIIKKKRPTVRSVIAGAVCFGGIALLSLGSVKTSNASPAANELTQQLLGVTLTAGQCEAVGTVLTLMSGVMYAVHIAIVNVFSEKTHVMPLTFMQYLFAAMFAWIAALMFEKAPNLGECFSEIWLSLLYVSVLSTLVAFTFQNIGVGNAPPAFASIILCMESLFGCILSIIFTSEQLTWNIAVGAVIIIGSIVVSELRIKEKNIQKSGLQNSDDVLE
ncbi:MAG: DMT family transporter [Clostridia bacterium]|nr:DMT family transporter [Clostridia bacterium]